MTLSDRPVGMLREERNVHANVKEYVYDPWKWLNEHHRPCALALNLTEPAPPAMLVAPGKPYYTWQGFLPHQRVRSSSVAIAARDQNFRASYPFPVGSRLPSQEFPCSNTSSHALSWLSSPWASPFP